MTGEVHAPSRPSASGARLTGDDVQHLVAWYWCLKTTIPASDVVAVRVEADDAGNLDDVVVDMRKGRRLYHQVKAAVSARDPANVAWLRAVGARDGPSFLQRLHASWVDLGRPPGDIVLITSRPLDPNDLLLRGLDRLNHVGNHLRRAEGKLADLRRDLASHLQCDQFEVCRFFDALAIHPGQTEAEWRRKVDDVAMGAGLRTDHAAHAAALADVREWVKTTRDPRDGAAVAATIDRLGLRAEPPRAVVVINGIDDKPPADDAVMVLDWVARFRGERPETRRGLVNPSDWNGALTDDLVALRDRLRAQDLYRVLVRASLRLPGWFAVGAALRDVAGFDIAMRYRGELWRGDAADAPRPDVRVLIDESTGSRPSVALVVAVSGDGTADVRSTLGALPDVGRLLTITIANGPDRRLFSGSNEAMAAATAVRDWVRRCLAGHELHLVLIGPAPFAFFLGHLWDRVPPTTVYEDLAPGYEPAFRLRN